MTDFPRGKAKVAVGVAQKVALNPQKDLFIASEDNDQQSASTAVTFAKSKRKPDHLGETGQKKHKISYINGALSFNKLFEGMVLLGTIREIHSEEVLVSLPNGLTGIVTVENLHNGNTLQEPFELVKVGQFIRCVVMAVTRDEKLNKKRLSLSMIPSIVNSGIPLCDFTVGTVLQAQIRSIEEHGYILDIGVSGKMAFSPLVEGLHVVPNQIFLCVLQSSDVTSRVWNVSIDIKSVSNSLLSHEFVTSSSTIKAGCLVSGRVEAVDSTGVKVKFCEMYRGAVPWSHAYTHSLHDGQTDIQKIYAVGQKVKARIVYSFPNDSYHLSDDEDQDQSGGVSRTVGLSLLPHIVSLVVQQEKIFTIGEILDEVVVIKVDSIGLWVSLNDDNQIGFVHISRLSDEHVTSIDSEHSKWKLGSRHMARVISKDLNDNVVQLSMQQSVLDARYMHYSDVKVGQIIPDAVVTRFDAIGQTLQLNISGSGDLRAFCPKTHFADVPVLQKPSRFFKEGSKIKVRVLTVDAAERKVVVTHKKTLINSKLPIIDSIETASSLAKLSDAVWSYGVVCGVKDFGVIVMFYGQVKGLVHRSQVSADKNAKIDDLFVIGQLLKCRIVSVEDQRLKLSLLEDTIPAVSKVAEVKLENDGYSIGSIVYAVVTRVVDGVGLFARIEGKGKSTVGRIHITDINDNYQLCEFEKFGIGMRLQCRIIASSKKQMDLSMRPSVMVGATDIVDPIIATLSDLKVDQKLRGIVKNVSSSGLFVALGRSVTGRVLISQISDDFIKDWQSMFKIGQLVECVVTELDLSYDKVELSLKMSRVDPEQYRAALAKLSVALEDLEVGSVVTGVVARVEDFGVFVSIDKSRGTRPGTQLRGLCHRSLLSDEKVKEIGSLFSEGDRVRAVVIKIDLESHRLSLSMKPSDLPDKLNDINTDEDGDKLLSQSICDEQSSRASVADFTDTEEMEVSEDFLGQVKPLEIVEELSALSHSQLADSDSNSNDATQKLSKRAKARAKSRQEAEIVKREQALLNDEELAPQSPEDFDRLLMASCNSSFLWIQYISFMCEKFNILKARQVAERAIETIHFREEREKFNVWISYLNLEYKFGTEQSLKQVLDRALQYNNPKHVYLSLARIYEESDEVERTEETYAKIVKKFKTSCKVWECYAVFLFKHKKLDEGRGLLVKAEIVLPKRKHLKFALKFARLEYQLGDLERGRTIYESLISNNPKRTDIWSSYVDIEAKNENIDYVRRLYQRMVALQLNSRKMKFIFKKYLDFEKTHGDEASVLNVVSQAKEYVAKLQSKQDEDK